MDDNTAIETVTIVRTTANEIVVDFHHRMTVIPLDEQRQQWHTVTPETAQECLDPFSGTQMDAYQGSTAVIQSGE
jgi:putative SOS response-associated peptidase YedK